MRRRIHSDKVPLFLTWLNRRGIEICFLIISFSAIPTEAFTQQQEPQPLERARRGFPVDGRVEEVLRIDTDVVAVDVRVTARDGRPVRNLRPEDFKLYEDNSERPISFFQIERKNGDQQPVAVVFALDVSGSMSAKEMERLRSAMSIFRSWLAERPSMFAVLSFGMNVRVLQSFTGDSGKLDQAFDRLTKESSGLSTHVYDAVDDAIRMLDRKAPRTRDQRRRKRVFVVVTDGFPVGDTVSPQTVIERANEAEVSVYTVTLPSFSTSFISDGRAPLPTPLDVSGLVEQTGGLGIYATDRDFAPLFRVLAAEVTSSYVLAFYPTDEKRRDGKFHTIRVKTPNGLNAQQSRPGFLGNMH